MIHRRNRLGKGDAKGTGTKGSSIKREGKFQSLNSLFLLAGPLGVGFVSPGCYRVGACTN
ncbi:hypothetical protein COLO4_19688 [Corchorus olitorius]|uniref:Uncharacterized protein n=1 Tax=Corchorus olitorius TaxID=93759 RepID=A0A1R3J412_9ROSI|nr:hypothetical protein COLO4_19688 [Corchorus olitorius]